MSVDRSKQVLPADLLPVSNAVTGLLKALATGYDETQIWGTSGQDDPVAYIKGLALIPVVDGAIKSLLSNLSPTSPITSILTTIQSSIASATTAFDAKLQSLQGVAKQADEVSTVVDTMLKPVGDWLTSMGVAPATVTTMTTTVQNAESALKNAEAVLTLTQMIDGTVAFLNASIFPKAA